MVRGLAPRNLALSDLRRLKKKVSKNTKILRSRELSRSISDIEAAPSTTVSIQFVPVSATGDDIASRHGRKIHASHVVMSGNVAKHTSAPFSIYRNMLVKDTNGTTTPPVIGDLFQDADAFFQGHPRLMNPQILKRFKIIWDKIIPLNEAFDGNTQVKLFKMQKKLNFDIYFSGAAVTDEGKNGLWLFQSSDEATNVPAVDASITLSYSDL